MQRLKPTRPTDPAPNPRPSRSFIAPVEPMFLNAKQAQRLLQLSERQFRTLRDDPKFPHGRYLGPRSARWHRDELIAFFENHLKPVAKLDVPPQFAARGRKGEADERQPG